MDSTTTKATKTGGFQLELLAGSKLTYDRPPPSSKKERKKQLKEKKQKSLADRAEDQDEVHSLKNGEKSKKSSTNLEQQEKRRSEEVRQLRKQNRIFTWGPNIADPVADFGATAALPLPAQLRQNIRAFVEPTPVQMQAIPVGLQHRDLLVTAPTGSGKTLAFAIPVILRALDCKKQRSSSTKTPKSTPTNGTTGPGCLSAIVLEPTKVLAKQTLDNFTNFCTGLELQCAYLQQGKSSGGGGKIEAECDILICTPNRLIFALEKMDESAQALFLANLQWLIVDECDRIFERTEGEGSFRVQLAKILDLCNGPETRRGFFSATFSYDVEQWCKDNLHNVAMVCIGPRNSSNEMIQQELLFVGWEQAKLFTVRDIVRRGFEPPALIFLQSKDRAKQLYAELNDCISGVPIGLISGDLSEDECQKVLDRFRSGAIWLLICTEILGRGLDFKDVNLVINFDLPTSIVSYIHRIGRTGRAGRIGRAITLFTESDMPIIRPIATVIHQAGFPVPDYLLKLHNPTREQRKQLKRKAPHRRNLLPNWGRLKHKMQLNGEHQGLKKKKKKQKTAEEANGEAMDEEKNPPKNGRKKGRRSNRRKSNQNNQQNGKEGEGKTLEEKASKKAVFEQNGLEENGGGKKRKKNHKNKIQSSSPTSPVMKKRPKREGDDDGGGRGAEGRRASAQQNGHHGDGGDEDGGGWQVVKAKRRKRREEEGEEKK